VSWTILIGLVIALALAVFVAAFRRAELARMQRQVEELDRAREKGSHKARLQYPHVDLSRCLGCGTCVRACPEDGVLALIHGQALVVHGARCVGHGKCALECPTDAITITISELESRRDIPALDERFEVPGQRGLFLGGEVTGYALIRTAITHGTAIADEVARRVAAEPPAGEWVWDLVIVGAGPAGLACALQAKAAGLRFLTIEQDSLGGTVSKYPRRKLVMTHPVDLPLHGRLEQSSYQKEELIELWHGIVREHQLPIRTGVRFDGLARQADGTFEVRTDAGTLQARNVCLALGRRGVPRKLGVPGEELPKVAYSLIDAQSYQGRSILVVGGGDSAIEAALALAEQPGNRVTLSYRQHAFFRIKSKNEERLAEARAAQQVEVLFKSQVVRITDEAVDLRVEGPVGTETITLPNDDVFVLAGGIPPFELLETCGVSFDPADRPPPPPLLERGTGLLPALNVAFVLTLLVLGWVTWHSDYYLLPAGLRPAANEHEVLRPSGGIGLALGFAATGLILANLAYLLRRSPRLGLRWGSLKAWMTAHVATGILALLFALLHSAMAPQDNIGRRALAALAVVVSTGAIGRYLYSFVPRAANGRELELGELKGELAALAAEWDRENRDFGERVQAEVERLVARGDWQRSFLARLGLLATAPLRLHAALERLRAEGTAAGLPADQIATLMALARRAHRTALMAAHFEDLRSVVGTWRYLHRWIALLMVLLLFVHILASLRYGHLFG
jgi:thioredoxin reductase/NAD-dependent dihydropyrimidine dehydrogenase PreA subunit